MRRIAASSSPGSSVNGAPTWIVSLNSRTAPRSSGRSFFTNPTAASCACASFEAMLALVSSNRARSIGDPSVKKEDRRLANAVLEDRKRVSAQASAKLSLRVRHRHMQMHELDPALEMCLVASLRDTLYSRDRADEPQETDDSASAPPGEMLQGALSTLYHASFGFTHQRLVRQPASAQTVQSGNAPTTRVLRRQGLKDGLTEQTGRRPDASGPSISFSFRS